MTRESIGRDAVQRMVDRAVAPREAEIRRQNALRLAEEIVQAAERKLVQVRQTAEDSIRAAEDGLSLARLKLAEVKREVSPNATM